MIILMILVEIYFISHLLKAVWKEIEFECRYAACSSQFLTKKVFKSLTTVCMSLENERDPDQCHHGHLLGHGQWSWVWRRRRSERPWAAHLLCP